MLERVLRFSNYLEECSKVSKKIQVENLPAFDKFIPEKGQKTGVSYTKLVFVVHGAPSTGKFDRYLSTTYDFKVHVMFLLGSSAGNFFEEQKYLPIFHFFFRKMHFPFCTSKSFAQPNIPTNGKYSSDQSAVFFVQHHVG